jgi:uncharacterized protein YvpB
MARIFRLTAVLISALALAAILAVPVEAAASSEPWPTSARVLAVPQYYQHHSLDCETAALQMALAYRGIHVAEDTLLAAENIDWRAPVWNASGFHWGDPFTNFVGNPDGSERALTGYGTYAPNIARVARRYGGQVLFAGRGLGPLSVYRQILAGRPVIAWVSFDWRWHQTSSYIAFDGVRVPFGSPYEHAVTLSGVGPNSVLVNNPEYGKQWIARSTFEAAYATFGNMAVVLS